LNSVDKSSEDEDMEYISTIILPNLKSLKNDLKQLVEHMIIFQDQKVNEMIYHSDREALFLAHTGASKDRSTLRNSHSIVETIMNSTRTSFKRRNYSLFTRRRTTSRLYPVVNEFILLSPYLSFADSRSDWEPFNRLQQKQTISEVSMGFKIYMSTRGFSENVNNELFKYLQSPRDYYGNCLKWDGYQFVDKEWMNICQFLIYEWKLVVNVSYEEWVKQKKEKEKN
jgi:hypothetical protein